MSQLGHSAKDKPGTEKAGTNLRELFSADSLLRLGLAAGLALGAAELRINYVEKQLTTLNTEGTLYCRTRDTKATADAIELARQLGKMEERLATLQRTIDEMRMEIRGRR
jgi:hypothetical protein